MTDAYTVAGPRDETELQRLLTVLSPIFHVSADYAPRFRAAVGDDNFRLVRRGEDVAGGLALVPMGQYFGGRSISMTGIVTVGIAPHYRARGAASALMAGALREMYETQSCDISTLYPATVPVYRRAGYELAGSRFEITLATSAIDIRDTALDARPTTDEDRDAVRALYRESVSRHNGPLDRGDYIWNRVTTPRGEPAQGYIVHEDGRPAGYLYYTVKGDPMDARLVLNDLVAVTPAAGRRLLTLLADHRSMEKSAVFYGGPSPNVLMHLREAAAQVRLHMPWMLRIVDVRRALTERGYAQGLNAELHLQVSDDLIDANNSRFVVRIADGRAAVEPGGAGSLHLHIRALAALYSGYHTAEDLIAAGMAACDDDTAIAAADAIFRGPQPWMVSIF